jgi:hypothetical protein
LYRATFPFFTATHRAAMSRCATAAILLLLGTVYAGPAAFLPGPPPPRRASIAATSRRSTAGSRLSSSPSDDDTATNRTAAGRYYGWRRDNVKTTTAATSGGYRFGDVTRGLLQRATSDVTQLTGKESYEFGDLSRWMDRRMKERVGQVTGKGADYAFGDLTAWTLERAQGGLANFTHKEDYEFGDLGKEVLRRVQTGEYSNQDVYLALRVLLSAGLGVLSPVAALLPMRLLLNLINLGLAQEVGGRVLEVLAGVLDKRVKKALTGSEDYQVGDLTKGHLKSAISSFTGSQDYQLGDISRTIQRLAQQEQQGKTAKSRGSKIPLPQIQVKEDSLQELELWDAKIQERS